MSPTPVLTCNSIMLFVHDIFEPRCRDPDGREGIDGRPNTYVLTSVCVSLTSDDLYTIVPIPRPPTIPGHSSSGGGTTMSRSSLFATGALALFLGSVTGQESCVQVANSMSATICPCDTGSLYSFTMEGKTTVTANKVRPLHIDHPYSQRVFLCSGWGVQLSSVAPQGVFTAS